MISGEQIEQARKLLGWSPSILAQRARRMTSAAIKRAEAGDETALSAAQLTAIKAAFSRVGVRFENGVPVLIGAPVRTPEAFVIIEASLGAFAGKTSLEQKQWEFLMLG
jgi:hypothetical protein